jgi:hypothetical protein
MSDQPVRNPDVFRQRQFQKTQFGHDAREVPRPSYHEEARQTIAKPARGMMISAAVSVVLVFGIGAYALMTTLTNGEMIRSDMGRGYTINGQDGSKLLGEELDDFNHSKAVYVNAMFTMMTGGILIGTLALMTVNVFIVVTAGKMLQLKAHKLAFVASILCVIPVISPLLVVGIPFGIWSLIVLNKPHVLRGFGVPTSR